MLSQRAPVFPGDWATCVAGAPVPLGAIQAPDKFTSFVCMWPEKEFVLGRGGADLHEKGMDAWFPHGGEWSASGSKARFLVLVDDGKIPGLYTWIGIGKLGQMPELEPLDVNGLSPVVVNGILGKGSVKHLLAWTSINGKEHSHDQEAVLNALVLCRRLRRSNSDHGWREIHIHEPPRLTNIRNELLATCKRTLINESTEKVKILQIKLDYQRQEGQEWEASEEEDCTLDTVIKSENVIRKLAEEDYTLGRTLYGTKSETIQSEKVELIRNYEVGPGIEMVATVSVYKQSMEINCPAMEYIYTKDGTLVLRRLVNGHWRAVTTDDVKVEITERKMKSVP